MILFNLDILRKENNERKFWGAEDGGNYCVDAETVGKEDAFEEVNANFEIIPYVDMAAASTYTC